MGTRQEYIYIYIYIDTFHTLNTQLVLLWCR